MRALAKKLEKEEQRHAQHGSELERLRIQMSKLRATCPHERIEMRGDVVVCRDCFEEVAYAKRDSLDEEYDDEDEEEEEEE